MINFQFQDVRAYDNETSLVKITKTLSIIRQYIDKFPINTYYIQDKDLKEKYKDIEYFNQSMNLTILVDLANATDEFFFTLGGDPETAETLNYIEVVTEETARSNDMDFDITKENICDYIVGEQYSLYTKIANTGYYFREM